jgi:hypothetical protein
VYSLTFLPNTRSAGTTAEKLAAAGRGYHAPKSKAGWAGSRTEQLVAPARLPVAVTEGVGDHAPKKGGTHKRAGGEADFSR